MAGYWSVSLRSGGLSSCRFAGDETYDALQLVLTRMLECGSLKRDITVPVSDGVSISLNVEWHLGGDLKLVLLLRGHSGCSSNKPCPMCTWNRSDPRVDAPERTESSTDDATELAAKCVPLWRALKELQDLRAMKREVVRVNNAVSLETKQRIQQASDERDTRFNDLKAYMSGSELPPSLRNRLNDASLIKRLNTPLPRLCLIDPTQTGEFHDPRAHAMNTWLTELQTAIDSRNAHVTCLRQAVQIGEADQRRPSPLPQELTESNNAAIESTQRLLDQGSYCSGTRLLSRLYTSITL